MSQPDSYIQHLEELIHAIESRKWSFDVENNTSVSGIIDSAASSLRELLSKAWADRGLCEGCGQERRKLGKEDYFPIHKRVLFERGNK